MHRIADAMRCLVIASVLIRTLETTRCTLLAGAREEVENNITLMNVLGGYAKESV
jgi:hypothetical protein